MYPGVSNRINTPVMMFHDVSRHMIDRECFYLRYFCCTFVNRQIKVEGPLVGILNFMAWSKVRSTLQRDGSHGAIFLRLSGTDKTALEESFLESLILTTG